MPNFTKCGIRYINDPDLIARYNYSGPVKLISPNPETQITYKGCIAVCGRGNQWYPWATTSATITTWVLPIVGTLLQAPFESNAFWRTVKACNRWIGSPISSLASILWDIEVSGKCALFVDMALPYGQEIPDEHSDFASIRDSFYILMNLNQYKMKPVISMTKEAEGLLRIVLFSKDLKLIGTRKTLGQMRLKLARDLRQNRRRGTVPVFISTLWFIVSLGISIESAFGDVGSNAQAHDLAIGLFLAWFPILILCSILDRNPVASDDIERKLNKMVDLVCLSLQNDAIRADYISSFRDLPQSQQMAIWVEKIHTRAEYIKGNYFQGFAGQARTRFHYGAAYAILLDIEKAYIAEHGRHWLKDTREARASLVLGQVDRGFVWFDGRQLWQVFFAVALVGGTGVGAFTVSFFTPTVGLGCRTGGYLIFFVIALTLLISEILIWWLTSPLRNKDKFHLHVQQYTHHFSERSANRLKKISFPGLATSKAFLGHILKWTEAIIIWTTLLLIRILPMTQKADRIRTSERRLKHHFETLHNLTTRNWLQRAFFTPLEFVNMVWLCYLVAAQTIGAFNNCACMSSTWGSWGGYIDLTQWDQATSNLVEKYWITGTTITCVFMGIGMIYIIIEWLVQAHLSTENYRDAAKGLQRVRYVQIKFRHLTHWMRYPSDFVALSFNTIFNTCGIRETRKRRVLVWSKESHYKPRLGPTIMRLATDMQHLPFREPLSQPDPSYIRDHDESSTERPVVQQTGNASLSKKNSQEGDVECLAKSEGKGSTSTTQRPDSLGCAESPRTWEQWDEEKGL